MRIQMLCVLLIVCLGFTGCISTQNQQGDAASSQTEPQTQKENEFSGAIMETDSADDLSSEHQAAPAGSVQQDIIALMQICESLSLSNDMYSREQVEMLVGYMAERGHTAVNSLDGNTHNQRSLLDFVSAADRGLDSEAALLIVNAYGINHLGHYRSSAEGITLEQYHMTSDGIRIDSADVENIVITEFGYLVLGHGGENPLGIGRVIPQSREHVQAYRTYVEPVWRIGAGMVLLTDWDIRDNIEGLRWHYIFESIMTAVEGRPFETEYRDPQSGYLIYPAEFYEALLQRYFDVSAETLRAETGPYGEIYNTENNSYFLNGFEGGSGPVTVEVWDIGESSDGSLVLTVVFVTENRDWYFNSSLTVMPEESGGFQYICNRMLVEWDTE